MARIDRKVKGGVGPTSCSNPSEMLQRYLNESHGVYDDIHHWGKPELRRAALEGWNRVEHQEIGRLQKGPDMMRRLERYMDSMTTATDVQLVQERMGNGGEVAGG